MGRRGRAQLFKTAAWWEEPLKKECGETCDITVKEAACFGVAWQEWFESGHEYAIRDREFLQKGLDGMEKKYVLQNLDSHEGMGYPRNLQKIVQKHGNQEYDAE